jgi:hypothetical protein
VSAADPCAFERGLTRSASWAGSRSAWDSEHDLVSIGGQSVIPACLERSVPVYWKLELHLPGPRPALRSRPQVPPEGGRQASERPAGSTTRASREPHKNPTSPRPGPAPTGIPRTRQHSVAHPGTPGKIGPYMSTEQRKPRSGAGIPVLVDGGQGQDRTVDLPLFRRICGSTRVHHGPAEQAR